MSFTMRRKLGFYTSTLRGEPIVLLYPQILFLNLSGSRSPPDSMAPDLAENGTNFRRARGGEMRKFLTLPVSVMKIVMPTTQHSGHPIRAIYKDLSAQKSPKSHTCDL